MADQENLFDPSAFEPKRPKKTKRKENKTAEVDLTNYTVEKHGKLEVYIPIDTNLELPPEVTFEATRRASVAYQTNQAQAAESLLRLDRKADKGAEKPVEETEARTATSTAKQSSPADDAKASGASGTVVPERKDGDVFDSAGTTVRRRRRRVADTTELGKLFENSAKSADDTGQPKQPTESSSIKELTYDEMLTIIFTILNKRREDSDNARTLNVDLKVDYHGTKKTLFYNFEEICSQMHRSMDHVVAYLSSELRQQTTIDHDNVLSFKARISATQLRGVIRTYLRDYVQCNACLSYNTLLSRDGRMYLVHCEDCSASRTVPAISKFSDE
ncbi:Protein Translation Initiation Factor 2 subunit beta (IF-2b) [Giardia duodenalis]|uniref:Protein Translation Initiation Factor 2 subunit beta (IF-2b) n=1 Tax=Giardia intestinalis TaxID=5741 RepID=V6TA53_GIAIN|nr:Protein Translation Initiation Factor 2 subunit beta (IF-2b) [Giardia intestinalis]